ncbi:MAG: 50S ribosomal protein L29 [Bacteroidetes bacterium]|nr:50S ribosomal protein L29 [Bacteroidota bacterium]
MKAHELRQLSDAELLKRIAEEEQGLANLRFQKVLGQLEKPHRISAARKDIARMQSILRERSMTTKKPQ